MYRIYLLDVTDDPYGSQDVKEETFSFQFARNKVEKISSPCMMLNFKFFYQFFVVPTRKNALLRRNFDGVYKLKLPALKYCP